MHAVPATRRTARWVRQLGLIAAWSWLSSAGGCGTATAWHTQREANFEAQFPQAPQRMGGHEGKRVVAQVVSAEDERDIRYEVAIFRDRKPLSKAERDVLMAKVVRGLRARQRSVTGEDPGERLQTLTFAEQPAWALSLELGEDQRGHWRLFYDEAQRMFQVSVVGPDDEETKHRSERFFASFSLTQTAGPP